MTELVISQVARDIIIADVRADKREVMRHAAYCRETGLALADVAAHVALFREEYKRLNKNADGDAVKAYATKVRNGLNRALGKTSGEAKEATALITSLGVASTLEEVTAAWRAAQK